MENYVTVAIFTYASEYAILEHLLQQAEIPYVFENETMISVLPFHSNAFGGIRLKVHSQFEYEAKNIIQNLDSSSNLKII
jgi:small basic protein